MSEFVKLLKRLEGLTTGANASCKEFTNLLLALDFQIENCGSAGHKIARHPALSLIEYPNYNCGHTKKPLNLITSKSYTNLSNKTKTQSRSI